MLQVSNLVRHYGVFTVLNQVSFIINDAEHVGLIGPNGAGKSTILRCVAGLDRPDAGTIARHPPSLRIGYLPQGFDAPGMLLADVLDAAQRGYRESADALERAAAALAAPPDLDAALADYDAALLAFEALGGYERETRATAVLDGLGLGTIARDAPLATLSGGQKTRLGLAGLLLGEPDLLLLDEPTNHLDVAALEWLEGFVSAYPKSVLIVSHDRAFLDATVTRVLYLDAETRELTSYVGGYSDFAAAREHEAELQAEAYLKQQQYVGKVETDIARLKGQALSVENSTTPGDPTVRRYAKKVAKKAKSREHKLERYSASDDRVEKPKQHWGMKLDFGPPPGGRSLLRVEHVSFGYPGGPQLIHDLSFDLAFGERLAIVGRNGAGKTTLLRLIAGELAPDSGAIRVGSGARLGVLSQEGETLDPQRTVLETAMAERAMTETEARTFLHLFLFAGDSVRRRVSECSYGERTRLQLARLVLRGCNILLLDEPLNHLDIETREQFEEALLAFGGSAIAVSHDRAFVEQFAERVIDVGDDGMTG